MSDELIPIEIEFYCKADQPKMPNSEVSYYTDGSAYAIGPEIEIIFEAGVGREKVQDKMKTMGYLSLSNEI